jgi:hypothetical protein
MDFSKTTSSRASSILVRIASVFAVVLVTAPALHAADDMAYLVTKGGTFGTLDLHTGVFTSDGSLGQTVAGLGELNGTLYATTFENSAGFLYTVNPATASLTQIGTSAVDYFGFGSTLSGLFALDTSMNLYNLSTGTPRLIGATGLTFGATTTFGMSDNSNTLYLTYGPELYALNTSTGAAIPIGGTSGDLYGALVTVNGTLYGGEDTPVLRVDTIDPETAAVTTGASIAGTTNPFYGLAAVPEPSSLSLLGLAAIGMLWRRRATSNCRLSKGPKTAERLAPSTAKLLPSN